jgi:hypothetical protein
MVSLSVCGLFYKCISAVEAPPPTKIPATEGSTNTYRSARGRVRRGAKERVEHEERSDEGGSADESPDPNPALGVRY